jgi:(E)-4-hydroxy-3-methylbut-2-enyl-diphosphate synthase
VSFDLSGKVALVTGCRRGIGLAMAEALAGAGADIVRCTCNEIEAAEGLAQIVPRSPLPIVADIHHNHRMALAALDARDETIRLNQVHIRKTDHIKTRDS